MKAAIILALTVLPALPVASQTVSSESDNYAVIGDVVSGVQAVLSMDGKISFVVPHARVWLGDGREMRVEGGFWKVYPVDPSGAPAKVPATEFALYADHYMGHFVEISGGVIRRAGVDSAILALPGRDVILWFLGTPREDIRPLVENCTGLVTSSACAFRVAGVVTLATDGKTIGIRAKSIAADSKTAPGLALFPK